MAFLQVLSRIEDNKELTREDLNEIVETLKEADP